MSFMPFDCHNIIMDMPPIGPWMQYRYVKTPLDSLKMLADAGATVALEFNQWDLTETAKGVYDWSHTDEMIARARSAGMRVLLMCAQNPPTWFPDDWYVWNEAGVPIRTFDPLNPVTVWAAISPWNFEAMMHYNEYITMCCERYNSDEVLCIGSFSGSGEAFLPPGIAAVYDPWAIRSYQQFVGNRNAMPDMRQPDTQTWVLDSLLLMTIAQMDIYCESSVYREIWMQAHPYYSTYSPFSGNTNLIDTYTSVHNTVRPDTMNALLFTVFDNGHDSFIFPFIEQLKANGIQVWGGGEWSAGLSRNTPRAIGCGLRGLVTAPLHPYLSHYEVEPWEIAAVYNSAQEFRQCQPITA